MLTEIRVKCGPVEGSTVWAVFQNNLQIILYKQIAYKSYIDTEVINNIFETGIFSDVFGTIFNEVRGHRKMESELPHLNLRLR